MPALLSWLINSIWDQFQILMPPHEDHPPLGCHRPCIPDHIFFDKLVQILVFGCASQRIADATVSATTLPRRDGWIASGVMDHLLASALEACDRMIGLALDDMVVDGCITKAPCAGEVAGRSPGTGANRDSNVRPWSMPTGFRSAPLQTHLCWS